MIAPIAASAEEMTKTVAPDAHDVDARAARGLPVAADRVDVPSEPGPVEQVRAGDEDHQHDRHDVGHAGDADRARRAVEGEQEGEHRREQHHRRRS